jgi:hypothetical protein
VHELLKAFADLAGAVLTTGAMHTQHDTAQVIPDRGADYVMTVKASMPGLYEQLKKLPWACTPSVSPVSTGHGRRARRSSRPRWRRPGPGSTVPPRSRTCAAWPSASRAWTDANIAAANRHHARDPKRTLKLLQTA